MRTLPLKPNPCPESQVSLSSPPTVMGRSISRLGRFVCRLIPACSGVVCREKRQIVRPTREEYGILPEFGSFDWGLIHVRSEV